MTIGEEIQQLKTQLEGTADEKEQAELLLELLKKYASINSNDSQPYAERLLLLSESLNKPLYKAWALNQLAFVKRDNGEYEASIDLAKQTLAIFEQENEKKGIATYYLNIGTIYERQGNYPEALKNHFASLKLYEEIGDKQGIASSSDNIGADYYCQGNYPEALKLFLAALKLREEIGDKQAISNSYNNIAGVYYQEGNYPEALKNHFSALRLRQEIGDKRGIGRSYTNVANVYYQHGNYPEALKNNLNSLRLFEEIDDKYCIASSYSNIGVIYELQDNYPEALKNFFASLKLYEEIKHKQGIAYTYGNIGGVYKKQGNYPEALEYLFDSLKLGEEVTHKQGIAYTYGNIGEVYEKQGNYAEALKYLFDALKLGEEMGEKAVIKDSTLFLSNTYKSAGDFENALKYHEKYHQVEGEMVGDESKKQVTNLGFMHNLEQKEKDLEIEQLRNVDLKRERDRSDSLLLNILPAEVAEELKEKGSADAKLFDDVTVLFTDFVGFTGLSERLTPQQLVDELHACFSAFDHIISKYKIEKIKTVGDAYLAASGLPVTYTDHAEELVKAALEIRDFMRRRREQLGENTFEIRIGLHSGHVVTGIVGVKKFAYDIWGDTVNTAARMEQNGEAGKVNISEATYELVKDKFTCTYRGELEAKNKGKLKMYFVG